MDAFSAASGALQVFNAGLALAAALHRLISDFKHADEDVDTIAREVRSTNMIIGYLQRHLLVNDLHHSLQEAIKNCGRIFEMIKDIIERLLDRQPNSWRNISRRLMWCFYQKERLEFLRNDLEKSKSNLSLMRSIPLNSQTPVGHVRLSTDTDHRCHCHCGLLILDDARTPRRQPSMSSESSATVICIDQEDCVVQESAKTTHRSMERP